MAAEALREAAEKYAKMYGVDKDVLFRMLIADASNDCISAIEDVQEVEQLKALREKVKDAIERLKGRNKELERIARELYDCIDYVIKVEEGEIIPEDEPLW